MLEEKKMHRDKSGSFLKLCKNEFYRAIMDEDLGRVEDMSKTHGSNSLISRQDGVHGGVLWEGSSQSPLHLAASYGRGKSMQSLLSAGADPERRDQLGRTTLHLVITGWPSILTTAAETVESRKHSQAKSCLQLLCEHGVDVNTEVEGGSGETALHLSVRYKAASALRILASRGADVNAVDSIGMTPLHMAARTLHTGMTACLIEEGADVNVGVRHSGNTPLHLAVVATAMKSATTPGNSNSCIVALLERGAEVDAVNAAGMTPLQEVCAMGNEELVDLLLGYGADVNRLSEAGESCLFLFLNRKRNFTNSSLLGKLLGLTSPLTVYDQGGRLPSPLTQPRFFRQRDQLLRLTQQPRRLQDICKGVIYLQHVVDQRQELRGVLPERLYDFVFNYWENPHISLLSDGEKDPLSTLSGLTPA